MTMQRIIQRAHEDIRQRPTFTAYAFPRHSTPVALKIYLAGPDVFLADARAVGEQKKAICREFDFEGLFPLDNDEGAGADPDKIFRGNCALMRQADIGVFNLTPFRSPSADPGTVFELGFLFALGKPVYGYTGAEGVYRTRVAALAGPISERDGRRWDRDGYAIEDFGLSDNLMIVRSIEDAGGAIVAVEENVSESGGKSLAAFKAFTACLRLMRQRLGQTSRVLPIASVSRWRSAWSWASAKRRCRFN
jgi:nucleoside 2-deoxyribosyltransferase